MGLFDKVKKIFKTDDEEKDNNKVKSSDTNNPRSMDNENNKKNVRSFKYLDDLIHSGLGEISLDYDIELKEGHLIKEENIYRAGISLDVDNLIINGNGHKIDAKGKTRIFNCNGKNIIIKNITLRNGFTESDNGVTVVLGNGGAIDNNGSLYIYDSILLDNVAKERGGAIFNGGELNIFNSEFSNNTSRSSGGAISVGLGVLNIENSEFSDNTAKSRGGAISIENGDYNIQKCTFSDNQAEIGGAIDDNGRIPYVPASIIYDNEFNIEKSIFSNNSSQDRGGAINSINKLNISDSKLFGNKSIEGGAIFSRGNVKIFNCEIFNNQSQNNIVINRDSLQIYDSNFKNNKSDSLICNESNLGIFNCEFIENDIDEAVMFNTESCSVERCVFANNLSNEKSKNIINQDELTLINPKIQDENKTILNENHMIVRGISSDFLNKIEDEGIIDVEDEFDIGTEDVEDEFDEDKFDFGYLDKIIHESITNTIFLEEDICFENYEKNYYEGGIELDIDNLIIDGNGKTIDGAGKSRIFIITGKNITLKNITFKNGYIYKNHNNSMNNHGGALKISSGSDLTIKNCNFIDNTSEKYGGAIHNTGLLNIFKSELSNNISKVHGGAIYNIYGVLKISESTISKNISKWKGGAIYNIQSDLNIVESTFTENSVGGASPGGIGKCGYGGVIYNKDSNLIITESVLTDNIAESNGGVIYNSEGYLTINKTAFRDNMTNNNSGGVIGTVEKGLDKLMNFMIEKNELYTSPSINTYWNAEDINNLNVEEINLKDCIFEANTHYGMTREAIDLEYLKKYNLNISFLRDK